ncbi:hypothetical protein Taro_030052 [Colocasia esculenta]|uniref:Uncharacterized protein n=1 Tax=Colocasia esculenta TaxID=4460 RepID=A0A843VLG1_COLES|nr:hypothetical protein [Colocasia esculenta]
MTEQAGRSRQGALCRDGLVNAAYRAVAFTGSVPEYNMERTGHWIAVQNCLILTHGASKIENKLHNA